MIGTTSTEAKAAIAKEAGADEVILYSQTDFVEEVNRITDGKGVNAIYDGVGKTTFLKSKYIFMGNRKLGFQFSLLFLGLVQAPELKCLIPCLATGHSRSGYVWRLCLIESSCEQVLPLKVNFT